MGRTAKKRASACSSACHIQACATSTSVTETWRHRVGSHPARKGPVEMVEVALRSEVSARAGKRRLDGTVANATPLSRPVASKPPGPRFPLTPPLPRAEHDRGMVPRTTMRHTRASARSRVARRTSNAGVSSDPLEAEPNDDGAPTGAPRGVKEVSWTPQAAGRSTATRRSTSGPRATSPARRRHESR